MATYRTLRANTWQKLDLQKTKNSIGTGYLGLDTKNKMALDQTTWFLLRRLLFVMVLEFMPVLNFQINAIVFLSVLIIFHLTTYKPYTDPLNQFFEMLNESSVILLVDFTVLFSNANQGNHRYTMGWVYISLFCFLFVINLTIMVANLDL